MSKPIALKGSITERIRLTLASLLGVGLVLSLYALTPAFTWPKAKGSEFLAIFENGQGNVSGEAAAYIRECCVTSDAAKKLLEDSGFRVHAKQYAKNEIVRRSLGATEHFDEVVFGVRGRTWSRFWDIVAAYEVTIYVQDDQIVRVSANIRRTMP
jgi:hypothetical protein